MNSSIFNKYRGLYKPPEQALRELQRRQSDCGLVKEVTNFLGGDIPEYFARGECFVLARHIATPNNETLYTLELARRNGVHGVLSQDPKDKFTSVNKLKRRLARPEICYETSLGKIYRRLDIVDIPQSEGMTLENIRCRTGQRLLDFHNLLFRNVKLDNVTITDDSDWIDRNYRGKIRKYYYRFLALYIVHGVLIEDFDEDDHLFFIDIFQPSLEELQKTFGMKPIIAHAYDHSCDWGRFCLAHPSRVIPTDLSRIDV
jgi:hypothetical protein